MLKRKLIMYLATGTLLVSAIAVPTVLFLKENFKKNTITKVIDKTKEKVDKGTSNTDVNIKDFIKWQSEQKNIILNFHNQWEKISFFYSDDFELGWGSKSDSFKKEFIMSRFFIPKMNDLIESQFKNTSQYEKYTYKFYHYSKSNGPKSPLNPKINKNAQHYFPSAFNSIEFNDFISFDQGITQQSKKPLQLKLTIEKDNKYYDFLPIDIYLSKPTIAFRGDISKANIFGYHLENVNVSQVTIWPNDISKISKNIKWSGVISNHTSKPTNWSEDVWQLIQKNKKTI